MSATYGPLLVHSRYRPLIQVILILPRQEVLHPASGHVQVHIPIIEIILVVRRILCTSKESVLVVLPENASGTIFVFARKGTVFEYRITIFNLISILLVVSWIHTVLVRAASPQPRSNTSMILTLIILRISASLLSLSRIRIPIHSFGINLLTTDLVWVVRVVTLLLL